MRVTKNGTDYVSAPADYTDFFRRYYDYVVNVVRKAGIPSVNAEDVAGDILLKFYERDSLHEFDPSRVFRYDGKDHPARFKSFLTLFVLAYMRGHLERERRRRRREILLCDRPVGGCGDESWLSLFGATTAVRHADAQSIENTVIESVTEEDLVARMRAHIATVPRRSRYDRCDLLALYDEMIRQIRRDGQYSATALRQHFGVSCAAMHSWMWWLRTNLAEALDRPVPAKRPRPRRTHT